MSFVLSAVSGRRHHVRKDTECPFLRNVIDPTLQETVTSVNMDNTGPFVYRTSGVHYSTTRPIVKEAYEMIGASSPVLRFCNQGSYYYDSLFGRPLSDIYGQQYQVLMYSVLEYPNITFVSNPCIKAVEGFDPSPAHRGFAIGVGSYTPAPSSLTALLVEDE